ncbi:MAG: NAD(P)/FAD-dependent oxidoreductase [Gammaproteobacteria bacterium]
MKASSDVIVIGGGALGMLSARCLAAAGRKVLLLERGRAGYGTSRAGGGIMSPLTPWNVAAPVARLAEQSLPLLPALAAALAQDTGIDPEYRVTGVIYLDCAELEPALDFCRGQGRPAELLDESRLAQVAPAARRTPGPSLLLPDVAQLRNPRFLDALKADLQRRGVAVLEEAGEVRLRRNGDGIVVDAGRRGLLRAADVVVAAGAWSAPLLAALGVQLPVRPIRGQILWYMLPRPDLGHILMRGGRYVIPRQEGVVLVGSTVEDAGFDTRTTADAAAELRDAAAEMMPLLGSLAVQGQWAGLRPGTPDGIPLIGAVPGIEGLWLNTGHFRNGVNLAPASAELLAALLAGSSPALDPAPYDPAARMAQMDAGAYTSTD